MRPQDPLPYCKIVFEQIYYYLRENPIINVRNTVQYKFKSRSFAAGLKFYDGFAVENQLSPHQRWGLNYILDGTREFKNRREFVHPVLYRNG
jgi:hypothetical protein